MYVCVYVCVSMICMYVCMYICMHTLDFEIEQRARTLAMAIKRADWTVWCINTINGMDAMDGWMDE